MASGSLNLFDKLETYFFLSLSPLLLPPYRRFPLVSRRALRGGARPRVLTGLTSTIFQTRHAFNHERRAGGARWLGKFGQAMLFVPIIFSKFPINSVFMLIRSPSRAVTAVALPRTSSRNSCERAGVNRVSTMPVDPLFNWIPLRRRNDARGILTSNRKSNGPAGWTFGSPRSSIDVLGRSGILEQVYLYDKNYELYMYKYRLHSIKIYIVKIYTFYYNVQYII